jgi:hypothetical protein
MGNNMQESCIYTDFPLWIPLTAILFSLICYGIGAIILNGLGIIYSLLYLAYCLFVEIMVIYRSCKNCYYHGRVCGLGKGKIAPYFVRKGDPKKFAEKDISPIHLLPDFMVVIIPLSGGIYLLITNFSFIILGMMILLSILFFSGTAAMRTKYTCKHCKQKTIGCTADTLFNKKDK